jgi:hypothetical protein
MKNVPELDLTLGKEILDFERSRSQLRIIAKPLIPNSYLYMKYKIYKILTVLGRKKYER